MWQIVIYLCTLLDRSVNDVYFLVGRRWETGAKQSATSHDSAVGLVDAIRWRDNVQLLKRHFYNKHYFERRRGRKRIKETISYRRKEINLYFNLSHRTSRSGPHLLRLLELGAQIGVVHVLGRFGIGRSHLYTEAQREKKKSQLGERRLFATRRWENVKRQLREEEDKEPLDHLKIVEIDMLQCSLCELKERERGWRKWAAPSQSEWEWANIVIWEKRDLKNKPEFSLKNMWGKRNPGATLLPFVLSETADATDARRE